jgi:hypothetical protein
MIIYNMLVTNFLASSTAYQKQNSPFPHDHILLKRLGNVRKKVNVNPLLRAILKTRVHISLNLKKCSFRVVMKDLCSLNKFKSCESVK